MSATAAQNAIAVVGIDIGKNSFHIVALDDRGAIVLRQKWSRSQVEARFASALMIICGDCNAPEAGYQFSGGVQAHGPRRKIDCLSQGRDQRASPAGVIRRMGNSRRHSIKGEAPPKLILSESLSRRAKLNRA